MKAILAMLVLALVFVLPAYAQTKVAVVSASDVESQGMRTLILPKISADPHFALVADNHWDILLTINCMNVKNAREESLGSACGFSTIYGPDKYLGLLLSSAPGVAVGTTDTIANFIFAEFLDYSTEAHVKTLNDVLLKQLKGLIRIIHEYDQAKNGKVT